VSTELPSAVKEALVREAELTITDVRQEPLLAGTGRASAEITRLLVTMVSPAGEESTVPVVRKTLSVPPIPGASPAVKNPRHWTFWRREVDAYASGLLPTGPGLRAPRCLGLDGPHIYLEDISGPAPSVEAAARHLGAWQSDFDPSLDRPWLACDQLQDRISITELDWKAVDADPRVLRIWRSRERLLDALSALPVVRSHGDYGLANLSAQGPDTVAFDWATFGWEPIGFDLAHLALSSGADPRAAYLSTAPTHRHADVVDTGFRASIALVGVSRLHWMLVHELEVPQWFVDIICDAAPSGRVV
jgi:hypothetical protein